MSTTLLKKETLERKWYVIDATAHQTHKFLHSSDFLQFCLKIEREHLRVFVSI